MSSSNAEPRTCPSAPCAPGATLLGIVNAGGSVGYVSTPLQIDDDFVRTAKQGRDPERRFRFANTCVESGCKQWTGSRCGVIDRVLADGDRAEAAALPHCAIRSTCRWFAQSGAAACGACPLVVTDRTDPGQSASSDCGTT
jgi:hypothetical protein